MTKTQIIVGVSALLISSLYFIYGANGSQTLLDKTIEFNTQQYDSCFKEGIGSTGSDTERYRASTDCWKAQRKLTSDDLFLTVPKYLVDEGRCSISQSEDEHVSKDRGGMYATDLACNFESQGVYATDYLDDMKEYVIESIGYDNLLGNFIILQFKNSPDMRWYFGHTVPDAGWTVGSGVTTGVRFAHADLSGATTGTHTHIEFRRHLDGIWQSVRYVSRAKERRLDQKRMGGSIQKASAAEESGTGGSTIGDVIYYFTAYNLGDPAQNDGNPCVGSSGKDLCKMEAAGIRTMALTVDIRKKMGIKFGDKVALTGEIGCEGLYQVEDEMTCRMRGEYAWANGPCRYADGTLTPKISNIKRPGTDYFIKGDLPSMPGGACQIRKL